MLSRRVEAIRTTPLTEWLLARARDDGRSLRQISMAAGLNPGALAVLLEAGTAQANTVIALAKAMGADPLKALIAMGVLQEGDLGGAERLSQDERLLLRDYAALSTEGRRLLRALADEMRPEPPPP